MSPVQIHISDPITRDPPAPTATTAAKAAGVTPSTALAPVQTTPFAPTTTTATSATTTPSSVQHSPPPRGAAPVARPPAPTASVSSSSQRRSIDLLAELEHDESVRNTPVKRTPTTTAATPSGPPPPQPGAVPVPFASSSSSPSKPYAPAPIPAVGNSYVAQPSPTAAPSAASAAAQPYYPPQESYPAPQQSQLQGHSTSTLAHPPGYTQNVHAAAGRPVDLNQGGEKGWLDTIADKMAGKTAGESEGWATNSSSGGVVEGARDAAQGIWKWAGEMGKKISGDDGKNF